MRHGRVDLAAAAIFCAAAGLYDAFYLWRLISNGPLVGPGILAFFPDFLVFQAAARAWIEGNSALVYDIDALTAFQATLFGDRLPANMKFRPFLYPPTWLLLLLPFAIPTAGKAYALFLSATAGLATALEGRHDWAGWIAILVSPAAVWVALTGQNTFFSLALFHGGMRCLDRAPATAGILLGLLAYKPQLWVLVPLALLAARRWKALAWTLGTVAALALASLVVLGPALWGAFFDAAREAGSPPVVDEMLKRVSAQMTSLFAAGYLLGLPRDVAGVLQAAGAALAIAAVWVAFRHHPSSVARTAVLATATLLVSPYVLNYDLLLLMPCVVGLFRLGARTGFLPGERILCIALWLMPLAVMVLNRLALPLAPLAIVLFGIVAWTRLPPPKDELRQIAVAG